MDKVKKDGLLLFMSIVLVVGTIYIECQSLDFHVYYARIFSDGFFLGGLLVLLYGLICVVYEGGIFHPFGYIAKIAQKRLTQKSTKDFPRYREYVEQHQKKSDHNYKLIFSLSILWIGVGLVFAFM